MFTAIAVRDCFRDAFAAHGLPASVLTDTGMVFTARHATRPGGRTALQTELATLGIVFKNSRPYHPQTCGKVREDLDLALHRPGSDPGQGMTTVSCVRFVDRAGAVPRRAPARRI